MCTRHVREPPVFAGIEQDRSHGAGMAEGGNLWTRHGINASKNSPQRERFPLLKFGISIVKEIELAIVVATGERFNFSKSKGVKWSWIFVECDLVNYSVLAAFLVDCNNFRGNR